MVMMRARNGLLLMLLITLVLAGTIRAAKPRAAAQEKKDYLSELEADKIRDAETTNERIKLFLAFAADRLKKFQYELPHPSQRAHPPEMFNYLMHPYPRRPTHPP